MRELFSEELRNNLKNTNTWLRIIFMVMFFIIYSIALAVMWAAVVIQLLFVLLTGEKNAHLLNFSLRLSRYIYQILLYLGFNSEVKPFPFSEWPTE